MRAWLRCWSCSAVAFPATRASSACRSTDAASGPSPTPRSTRSSRSVFEHLPQWDVFNYLREIARVLRPGGKAILHHGNVFSDLGWANFVDELAYTVDRHKPYGNFAVMTPELMRGFVDDEPRALDACRTDVVRRDAITLVRKG
jgi:SAM-dependent methyltransferase